MAETRLSFPADHPAGAGHFPGNPILPGALLLDAIWAAIDGYNRPCRVKQAKFHHILRPGQALDLRWETKPNGIAFVAVITGTETLAVSGLFA